MRKLAIIFPILLFSTLTGIYGMASTPLEAQEAQGTKSSGKVVRTDSLTQILRSMQQAEAQRKELQHELEGTSARGREEGILQRIEAISIRLEALEGNFREIASGIDAEQLEEIKEESEKDWTAEIRELLSPLIDEVKRATSRPRELSELRTSISENNERLRLIEKGLANLRELLPQNSDVELQSKLKEVEAGWLQRKQRVATELSIAEQKLHQREAEQKPILESVGGVFDIFFRSRGRNLILAFLVTFLFWYSLRRVYFGLQDREWVKRRGSSRKTRLVNVLYLFLSGVGSLIVFLFVLFFFGDWLLLVVAGMLLLGVLWSSRQMIPAFWGSASLLLDMGPVREGERLIFQGVPWKVGKINFFTTLTNPCLDGGFMRLPLQDLQLLRSRPAPDDSVWFPTNTNDWVLLADGTYGKVVSQGAEWVRLVELGNSYRTYATADYVALSPRSLTTGFRLFVTFRIDYSLQGEATKAIPQQMETFLREAFLEQELDKDDLKLKVEFAEAGASALQLAIICDCNGKLAPQYKALQRTIQRISVDACNNFGWGIPFNQLTVHMASDSQ